MPSELDCPAISTYIYPTQYMNFDTETRLASARIGSAAKSKPFQQQFSATIIDTRSTVSSGMIGVFAEEEKGRGGGE